MKNGELNKILEKMNSNINKLSRHVYNLSENTRSLSDYTNQELLDEISKRLQISPKPDFYETERKHFKEVFSEIFDNFEEKLKAEEERLERLK